MDLLCFSVLCLLCICMRVFICALFCLCCVAALKSLPTLSFNALIFPILRIVCTISFHYSCKGLTSWLSFVVSSVSLSLSHWYPGSGVVLDCIDS